MSVEERLREAYRDDSTSETSFVGRYDIVVSGSRRLRRQRLIAGVVLGVAALGTVLAVLSALRPPEAVQPAPPGQIVRGTPADLIAGGLGGIWRSQPMTRGQVVQGLREQGFGKNAVDYARTELPPRDFRVRIRIDAEKVSMQIGNRAPRTSRLLTVDSDEIELRPAGAQRGASTFSWALNGGALFFYFESTTLGQPTATRAFPPGAYDVATLGLATFTRVE